jgi:hypothetical protein
MVDVSVLIPCHNAERTIAEAIASALGQSSPPGEIVVVDDGSSDASLAEIQRFEGRIRWETQSRRGGGATRNRLLEMCSSDWVQYLDADDYLLRDKLACQIRFLEDHPDVDLVYGPSIFQEQAKGAAERYEFPIPEPRDPWVLLARWLLPQTGSPLWRRRALQDVGGWNEDQRVCQEHELYLRLLKAGKRFAYCPAAGAVYRLPVDSTVSTSDPGRTFRARMEITTELERHAEVAGLMTPELRTAVQLSRFEVARSIWPHDPSYARELVRKTRQQCPGFTPRGRAFPALYRTAYRSFGFTAAEKLAAWKRKLAG